MFGYDKMSIAYDDSSNRMVCGNFIQYEDVMGLFHFTLGVTLNITIYQINKIELKEEMLLSTYKKLIGNSFIFAIGNLGSKLISILLVPLYTYYLTTSEYGTVDLITTTTSFLMPIISLSIFDAVLRFTMDKSQPTDSVFTNALVVTSIGSLMAILSYPILSYFNVFGDLIIFMYFILIIQAFQSLSAQFVRAIGEIKVFAFSGIAMTIVTGVMNIVLLVYLNMGIPGYLLAIVFSNLVSIIYLTMVGKTYKYVNLKKINKNLTKEMLVYCIPLIPNALMWWVMNASSRYFILFFVGASANGLFAVANKIPSLLSILNQIFFQAWQLSAIEEYDSKNKSNFYSEVFNYFSMSMFLGTSGILIVIKPVMSVLVATEFYHAWKYAPFLLLGVVFSSFSGFLGTNYIAAKKTGGVFKTSIIGGILNIVLNFIFIPLVGTNGASLSTMISFFVIWVIRVYDTKQFINMKLDLNILTTNILIIAMQIGILYLNISSITELVMEILLFNILLIINRSLIGPFMQLMNSKRNRK